VLLADHIANQRHDHTGNGARPLQGAPGNDTMDMITHGRHHAPGHKQQQTDQ